VFLQQEKHGLSDCCPKYQVFTEYDDDKLTSFMATFDNKFAVKADGLKKGKGVKLCPQDLVDVNDALRYCRELIQNDGKCIIEELLVGEEFSLMSFCDGKRQIASPIVQDNKRAYDGDQ